MGALAKARIPNLTPRAKPYQVAEGERLPLEARPSGQKAWLYRRRLYGRPENLGIGSYPNTSPAKAREKHGDARKFVAAEKSPAGSKQDEKRRLSDDLSTISRLAKA